MGEKVAIFDVDDQLRMLNSADGVVNQVRCFMPLVFGMHNENLRRLQAGTEKTKGDKITKDGLLSFKRAKNKKARRELMSPEQAEVIWKVVKRGKLKISNQRYTEVFAEMSKDIVKNYLTPPVTLYSLRKTFILNLLRENWDDNDKWDIVSKRSGCTREVVTQNYLDLDQWMRLNEKEFQKAPDWGKFKFMEY